jgi:hypothetical protein
MISFKPKTTKIIKPDKKSSITLDGKHSEFLAEFTNDETVIIPKLKKKKNVLLNKLKHPDINIEQRLETTDEINNIIKEIKGLKKKKLDYFLNNSKYIFGYFENKKNISNDETELESANITTKPNLLNDYFKLKDTAIPLINENQIKNNNIVQKYFNNIDNTNLNMDAFVFQTDICRVCNDGEMILSEEEGLLICNKCFRSISYLIENEKTSYKEPPKEVCFYSYKRINHFKEILSQFQGKETTQIPEEVIENIKLQIKKERTDITQITNTKTKEMLKKLGYNKYYEHIPFIKNRLGIRPPIMSPELEETLCNLFIETQHPYSRHCPNERINFLNYYYTGYKLCELLGEKQYLPHFPMLKDAEKRNEQDIIWKNICEDLNWEFIPTI